MRDRGRRICELAEACAAAADDPERALELLNQLRYEVDDLARAHVQRGLAAGWSFGRVAEALGISRQAAHRRYRDLAPERPRPRRRRLVATATARHAMRLATAEAVASGVTPGSDHVLIGILRTGSDAARALNREGVTLEAARSCSRRTDSDGAGDGGSTAIRRILQQAGRIALARGDAHLGLEQLLLAALADSDCNASRTLTALGVKPAAVRARLGC